MTTVCFDGKVLAADRAQFEDDVIVSEGPKIARRDADGALIGVAGSGALSARFVRWFLSGGQSDPPSLGEDDTHNAEALIITKDGSVERHFRLGWHQVHGPHFAIGRGAELALGAMDAGASAELACQIATRRVGGNADMIDTLAPPNPQQAAFAALKAAMAKPARPQ